MQSVTAAIGTVIWFVLLRGLVSYVKASSWLCLQSLFTQQYHEDVVASQEGAVTRCRQPRSVAASMQVAGCVVQIGSLIGSLGMFILANVLHVFPAS